MPGQTAREGAPRRVSTRRWLAALVALVAVALAACGGGDERVREWRDVTVALPAGWSVIQEGDTLLSVGDGELGEEDGDRGTREVAAFFTYEPRTVPDDWRTFVDDVDGTMETDRSTTIDGAPATQLVFSHASNGVPTREMVVVIPARGIVILLQPIVLKGQTDGPDIFDAHRDEFEELVSELDFGAPIEARGGASLTGERG